MERLEAKAADGGLFFQLKFEVREYSSSEMEQLGEFLVGCYTRKLQQSVNRTEFSVLKTDILNKLSNAFDEGGDTYDSDGDTYEWPCDMVDILPRSNYQVSLANRVKKKLQPIAFEGNQRHAPAPYPPRPAADAVPLSALFATHKRRCNLCRTEIEIDDNKCTSCECECMPGQDNSNCQACRESSKGVQNGAVNEDKPAGGGDAPPDHDGAPSSPNAVPNTPSFAPAPGAIGPGGFTFTPPPVVDSPPTIDDGIAASVSMNETTNSCVGWSFPAFSSTKEATPLQGGGASNGEAPALVEEKEPVEAKKTEQTKIKAPEPSMQVTDKIHGPKLERVGKRGAVDPRRVLAAVEVAPNPPHVPTTHAEEATAKEETGTDGTEEETKSEENATEGATNHPHVPMSYAEALMTTTNEDSATVPRRGGRRGRGERTALHPREPSRRVRGLGPSN